METNIKVKEPEGEFGKMHLPGGKYVVGTSM